MDVRHALPRRFGDDAVDKADGRRIVRAVEQVVGGRNVGGQYVQLVRPDVERSRHGRRAALHRIMVRQMPVELRGIDETRSEEHTSELQSLMPHSYADFSLNKNTTNNN